MSELDAGDSYNFSPPAAQQRTLQNRFSLRQVRCLPGLQEMVLDIAMTLPAGLGGERCGPATDTVQCHGTLRLRLWQGAKVLDCQLDWHNAAQDQRTRLLLPIAASIDTTFSDSAFSWERRPVVLAAYPDAPSRREMPVCVNPSLSVVSASGLALAHRAMQEYEVLDIDGQRYLGLTLVRSVGWLSRRDLVTRGVGAGPDIATPGAQCLGTERFDFSIAAIDEGDPVAALALARRLRHPPVLLRGHSAAWRPPVAVGEHGLQTSALRQVGQQLELRVFNPGQATLRFTGGADWQRVTADGLPASEGLDVAPHAIATFRRPL
jgi:mannosylglycerate hydrolase